MGTTLGEEEDDRGHVHEDLQDDDQVKNGALQSPRSYQLEEINREADSRQHGRKHTERLSEGFELEDL